MALWLAQQGQDIPDAPMTRSGPCRDARPTFRVKAGHDAFRRSQETLVIFA